MARPQSKERGRLISVCFALLIYVNNCYDSMRGKDAELAGGARRQIVSGIDEAVDATRHGIPLRCSHRAVNAQPVW